MGLLKELTNSFFNQIQSIGNFLDINSTVELRETTIKRVNIIKSFFYYLESQTENVLNEGDEKLPFIYNTQSWPENFPISGYRNSKHPLPYSSIVESYFITWNYQVQYKQKGFPSFPRFLRSLLFICSQTNAVDALKYILDLYKYGYIIDINVVYTTISYLIYAYKKTEQDREMIQFFFEREPSSNIEWRDYDFVNFNFDGSNSIRSPASLIKVLIDFTLEETGKIRNSSNYDNWLRGQWFIRRLIAVVQKLVTEHIPNQTIFLKSILSQLEEIRADSGSVETMMLYKEDVFYDFNTYNGIITMFKSNAGRNWKERLLNERAFIPKEISENIFSHSPLSAKWSKPSSIFAPIIVENVLKKDYAFLFFYLTNGITKNIEMQDVQACLKNSFEIKDKQERLQYLQELNKLYPFNDFIHYELGICFDEMGEKQRAIESIKSAILIQPEDPYRWHSLGVVLNSMGEMKLALAAFAVSQMINGYEKNTKE